MRSITVSPLILCTALAACASARSAAREDGANSSAIIIRSSEISGSVLQALRTRIPSMRITSDGPCPGIRFRGALSMSNQPDPTIYIDNTLMGDTCSLTTISAHEVDRIEIYPNGDSPDATIRRNPSGIIIVYRRRE